MNKWVIFLLLMTTPAMAQQPPQQFSPSQFAMKLSGDVTSGLGALASLAEKEAQQIADQQKQIDDLKKLCGKVCEPKPEVPKK